MKLPRLTLLLTLALAAPLAVAQTTPPGPPTAAASSMFTLEDLWNRLLAGTPGTKRSGPFAEPTGAPGVKTMQTLNELMGAAPSLDETNGATVADVLLGKTFWGLTGGAWGLRTGTLTLVTGANITGANGHLNIPIPNANYTNKTATASDTNLVTGNIKAGATVFGVAGSTNVVDTTSGDAVAADLQAGKKAWVDGAEVSGTRYGGVSCPDQTSTRWSTNRRFYDNLDGTIIDTTTGLVWLKDANPIGPCSYCNGTTHRALEAPQDLRHGTGGLTDGSGYGDWRLPTEKELRGLANGVDAVRSASPQLFINVQNSPYWVSGVFVAPGLSMATHMGTGASLNQASGVSYPIMAVRNPL